MNPRVVFRVMVVLAVLGLADAAYLTIIHYAGIKALCTSAHNSCQQVQTSQYSKVAGVPVALLGLTVFGFGFSAFLTYQETFTIPGHPIYCEWCVGSAIVLTVLLALSVIRYLRPSGTSQPPPSPA